MAKTGEMSITVSGNGPYIVQGEMMVAEQHIVPDGAGMSVEWREGKEFDHPATFRLCRCGHTKTKPFCDGTHKKIDFDGTGSASRDTYDEQAGITEGPTLSLKDAESLCAFARFCDPAGQVWGLVHETDQEGPRIQFLHEPGSCPGGRLVAVDNETESAMEPRLEKSIGLVIDTRAKVDGPLWIRGGIPITALDGYEYEVRNRVALCRCGRSSNKPYCNGSHAAGAR